MKKFTIILFILLLAGTAISQKRAITFDDLFSMHRISSPQISPDGEKVIFVVRSFNIEKNKGQSDLYLNNIKTGETTQLTNTGYSEFNPRWSKSGKKIAFLSTQNNKAEIFTLSLETQETVLAATIPVSISHFEWSSNYDGFIFIADVYANAKDIFESADMEKSKEENPVKAHISEKLFFRSWNSWRDNYISQIFKYDFVDKKIINLTNNNFDSPPLDLGGDLDFCISKDAKTFYYTANKTSMPAANTNNDIFQKNLETNKVVNITKENEANDNNPLLSPNQKYLLYKKMARPGFEADQYNLFLLDLKKQTTTNLTENIDLSVSHVVWSNNSKKLYFTTPYHGRHRLYELSVKNGKTKLLEEKYYLGNIQISDDDKFLIVERQAVNMPVELFKFNIKENTWKQLTFLNKQRLDEIEMNPVEEYWVDGVDGDSVHVLMVKPPFFDPSKKYPLVVMIHGGPQGAFGDDFHYRWNMEMFASPGYIVIAPNFHGSRGYGQKFCDAVSKDWGGQPHKDVINATKAAIDKYNFIDGAKVGAAGASYGGFMIDWIEGHNQDKLFTCLISHAGVFDQRSMYGATEELWFPEWEFNGTPYDNPELYKTHSPSYYVKNFNTPCLVIAGEHDYRVPYTQSLQFFTALQKQNVPSKLIVFPDEDHFVRKPQNAKLWWASVYDWYNKYFK